MDGCCFLMQVSWKMECSGNIYVRICWSSNKNKNPPALSAHTLLQLHRIKILRKKSMGVNQYHLYLSILESFSSSNISSRCFLLSRTENLLSHICKILISRPKIEQITFRFLSSSPAHKEQGRHDSLRGRGKYTPWGTNATTIQWQGSPIGLGETLIGISY